MSCDEIKEIYSRLNKLKVAYRNKSEKERTTQEDEAIKKLYQKFANLIEANQSCSDEISGGKKRRSKKSKRRSKKSKRRSKKSKRKSSRKSKKRRT